MNKLYLIIFTFIFFNSHSQIDSLDIEYGIEYDARLSLSYSQKRSFNRIYQYFDSSKVEKNWEWRDVDPIGFFTHEENRTTRRKLFLFEHDPYTTRSNQPTEEQIAFKIVEETKNKAFEFSIDNLNAKVRHNYTQTYENFKPTQRHQVLEIISLLGLNWSLVGGENLYLYNGEILYAKFKSGYVSIVINNFDNPYTKYDSKLKK